MLQIASIRVQDLHLCSRNGLNSPKVSRSFFARTRVRGEYSMLVIHALSSLTPLHKTPVTCVRLPVSSHMPILSSELCSLQQQTSPIPNNIVQDFPNLFTPIHAHGQHAFQPSNLDLRLHNQNANAVGPT